MPASNLARLVSGVLTLALCLFVFCGSSIAEEADPKPLNGFIDLNSYYARASFRS